MNLAIKASARNALKSFDSRLLYFSKMPHSLTTHFQTLLLQLAKQAQLSKLKIGTAESCTGGLIAAACTELAGSSEWFECGIVSYSNQAKQSLLGVNSQTLESYGAVSQEVVAEMVAGLLTRTKVTTGVAVSGIAGPGGATANKPVGTVCIAWQHFDQSYCETFYFSGDRQVVRLATVLKALEGLLEITKTK